MPPGRRSQVIPHPGVNISTKKAYCCHGQQQSSDGSIGQNASRFFLPSSSARRSESVRPQKTNGRRLRVWGATRSVNPNLSASPTLSVRISPSRTTPGMTTRASTMAAAIMGSRSKSSAVASNSRAMRIRSSGHWAAARRHRCCCREPWPSSFRLTRSRLLQTTPAWQQRCTPGHWMRQDNPASVWPHLCVRPRYRSRPILRRRLRRLQPPLRHI